MLQGIAENWQSPGTSIKIILTNKSVFLQTLYQLF